jgi:DNA-binding CsgD family transcriptional regulator
VLDELLDAARAGEGRALVVRGEPGVGKTALLEHAIRSAQDFRVVRVSGVESEMELAFAGLHQLCALVLDGLERLPDPQREALRGAFGLSDAGATRFLVALAALGLLSEAAEERPLLCVVDDAQWLDDASAVAIAFVARRLAAESVAIVFAAREIGRELQGLPELVIEGLPEADARALLEEAMHERLDDRVRDRIVAETRGNPLALLELPSGSSAAELAGGFGIPEAQPLADRIEKVFLHRSRSLPPSSQQLLLAAAAEPLGDAALLLRAVERLGLGIDAFAAAEGAGLIEVGARVRFRHPLVRSAVYWSVSPEERREVHRALADVTDPTIDPDRRVWHLAEATSAPDEDVAAELERSAIRAQTRGGMAAAAAFLERAATLTPEPAARAERALAAANAKLAAGAFDAALRELATARAGSLDELQRARADVLEADMAFGMDHGRDAPALLLRAAKRLEPLDVARARETYLRAVWASQFAAGLGDDGEVERIAEAARSAPVSPEPRASDLLLDGLAARLTDGYAAAAPSLKAAMGEFRSPTLPPEEGLRWLYLAWTTAVDRWDDQSWGTIASRGLQLARDAGALAVLPLALTSRAVVHVFEGELAAAAALAAEQESVTGATGSRLAPYGSLAVAAWQGREATLEALTEAVTPEVVARGEGIGVIVVQWARAVLYNGLGRYEDARRAAGEAGGDSRVLAMSGWVLAELVEAASRTGEADLGANALERLAASTNASGSDWGLGIEARSRALLSEGRAAESHYRDAIERLGRTQIRAEVARAHLVYGEWLRRERRRVDARTQLRTAHDLFTEMGLEAFAERARRELRATGETARTRTVDAGGDLTPQEALIAQLARDGLSNPEIGGRLFISPRTVEYHLRKVFVKLDITSRIELGHLPDAHFNTALAPGESVGEPTRLPAGLEAKD